MKIIGVFWLVAVVGYARAEVELVPLDMEIGYWETTSTLDVEAMLADIPKQQREMVRSMMSSKMKMPVIKQCVTPDTLKDIQNQMKKSLSSVGQDCELRIDESSAQAFSGVLTCASGATMSIQTTVVNNKRLESDVTAKMSGMGQNNIVTTSEWKSSTCPAGI